MYAKRQAYIICHRLLGSILEGRVHLKIGPFLEKLVGSGCISGMAAMLNPLNLLNISNEAIRSVPSLLEHLVWWYWPSSELKCRKSEMHNSQETNSLMRIRATWVTWVLSYCYMSVWFHRLMNTVMRCFLSAFSVIPSYIVLMPLKEIGERSGP